MFCDFPKTLGLFYKTGRGKKRRFICESETAMGTIVIRHASF
jgi:hypothetical protein